MAASGHCANAADVGLHVALLRFLVSLNQGDHCFWKIIFHDFSIIFPGPKKWKSWPIGTTFFQK